MQTPILLNCKMEKDFSESGDFLHGIIRNSYNMNTGYDDPYMFSTYDTFIGMGVDDKLWVTNRVNGKFLNEYPLPEEGDEFVPEEWKHTKIPGNFNPFNDMLEELLEFCGM